MHYMLNLKQEINKGPVDLRLKENNKVKKGPVKWKSEL